MLTLPEVLWNGVKSSLSFSTTVHKLIITFSDDENWTLSLFPIQYTGQTVHTPHLSAQLYRIFWRPELKSVFLPRPEVIRSRPIWLLYHRNTQRYTKWTPICVRRRGQGCGDHATSRSTKNIFRRWHQEFPGLRQQIYEEALELFRAMTNPVFLYAFC